MATLGCGEYEAFVTSRGGRRIVGTLPWTAITWGRTLDDTSDASLDALVGDDCCETFAVARPWRHELLLVRDGDRVWEGPLLTVVAPPETPKVTARDLTAWWDRRLVHEGHSYSGIDLAAIFEALSDDAMAPDNSPGLFVSTSPTGILGDLSVLAAQHKKTGPLLRDLANAGIDWTAIGRQVLAGGLVVPVTSIGPFLVEHFIDPPTVKVDGAQQTNNWHVVGAGAGSQGDAIHEHASDTNAELEDGLLEDVANVSTIEDVATAAAAAASRLALTTTPVIVEQAVLSPGAPFSIDDLVPGALCQLRLDTCIPVDDYFRLQSVKVTAAAEAETIAVVFQPIGGPSV